MRFILNKIWIEKCIWLYYTITFLQSDLANIKMLLNFFVLSFIHLLFNKTCAYAVDCVLVYKFNICCLLFNCHYNLCISFSSKTFFSPISLFFLSIRCCCRYRCLNLVQNIMVNIQLHQSHQINLPGLTVTL